MKTKKITMLIVSLILLTGCEATVNLTITQDKVKEEVIITGSQSLNENSIQNKLKGELVKYEESGLGYKSEIIKNGIKLGKNYNDYDYNSSIALSYLTSGSLSTDDGNANRMLIVRAIDDAFDEYPELDKITVNIKAENVVIGNNADSIKGNTYTWVITRENCKDKTIEVSVNNQVLIADIEREELEKNSKNVVLVAVTIIGIIGTVVILYIIYKNRVNNSDF